MSDDNTEETTALAIVEPKRIGKPRKPKVKDYEGEPCDRCGDELTLHDRNHARAHAFDRVTDPTCYECREIENKLKLVKSETRREPSKHDWASDGFKKFEEVLAQGKDRGEHVKVYFKKHDATFAAYYRNMYFEAKDYKALEVALSEHLKKSETLTFHRYLYINYHRTEESRRHGGVGNYSRGGHYGRRDHDEVEISGIGLEYDVYDVSEPFETGCRGSAKNSTYKAQVQRRMIQGPNGEWSVDNEETVSCEYGLSTKENDEDGRRGGSSRVVPYTEERRATLDAIRDAIKKIDAKLSTIVGKRAKDVGLALDGLDATRLLGSGKQ